MCYIDLYSMKKKINSKILKGRNDAERKIM